MRKRKESGLDLIAAMPWPVGVALGVLGYLAIRFGIPAYFSASDSTLLRAAGQNAASGVLAPLAWMALGMCWIGAAASFLKNKRRRDLLLTQTGLASITELSWPEFEMLVGEAFRVRGYRVEETGLGGADGGVDLILRKDGRVELVQCKQWRNRHVRPAVVREMWGLRAHHGADAVKIVCVGEYTRDAMAFASGKAIDLVNGERLLALVREGQARANLAASPRPASPESSDSQRATCPRCNGEMVVRTNRKTGQRFLGCAAYPRCNGTRPA